MPRIVVKGEGVREEREALTSTSLFTGSSSNEREMGENRREGKLSTQKKNNGKEEKRRGKHQRGFVVSRKKEVRVRMLKTTNRAVGGRLAGPFTKKTNHLGSLK